MPPTIVLVHDEADVLRDAHAIAVPREALHNIRR